jgi:hypothetical protein
MQTHQLLCTELDFILCASRSIKTKFIRMEPPNPYIALTSRFSINEIKFFPPFIVPLFPALGVSG